MVLGITKKEQKIIEDILSPYEDEYEFYYYGSRVKGNFEKNSDLDVLIRGKQEMPITEKARLKELFDESYLPYIVNFSDFYAIDEAFYKVIEPTLVFYRNNQLENC